MMVIGAHFIGGLWFLRELRIFRVEFCRADIQIPDLAKAKAKAPG